MNSIVKKITLGCLALWTVALVGCGGGSNTLNPLNSNPLTGSSTYQGSGAVGDVLTFTVNHDTNTVTLQNDETAETINFGLSVNPTGSYTLLYTDPVTSATKNYTAWELQGVAFAAEVPRDDGISQSDMLAFSLAQGSFTRSEIVGTYNFLTFSFGNDTPRWGTANITESSGLSFTQYNIGPTMNVESGGVSESAVAYDGFELTVTTPSDNIVMYLTQSGAIVMDFGLGNGGAVGALVTSQSIDGSYLFMSESGQFGTVTISGNGTSLSYVVGSDTGTISLTQISTGIYQGVVPGPTTITFTVLPGNLLVGNARNNDGSNSALFGKFTN